MISLVLSALKIRKNRELINIGIFSAGSFISLFGTATYTFAIGLYVLKLTGSGMTFALTLVLSMIPTLIINPIAGVLADRFNRKILVVLMDILNGALLITLFIIATHFELSLIMIYVSTFIMNAFTAVFNITMETAKPNIVSEKKIMDLYSISKIINSVSSILGPIVGGMIFALIDIKLIIIINGISFLLSGVAEMFIDFNYNIKEVNTENSKFNLRKDIKEAFIYMINKNNIKGLFLVFVVINFFLGFSISVPLPYIINTVLELSPTYFGIIEGAFPIGMILGALVVKKIVNKFSYYKLLLLVSGILAICMVMIGLPLLLAINIQDIIYLIYYTLILGIIGVTIALIDIPILYILQKIISEEFRGRVLSLGTALGKVATPLAIILSGILINIKTSSFLPIIGGVILLIISIVLFKYLANKEICEEA